MLNRKQTNKFSCVNSSLQNIHAKENNMVNQRNIHSQLENFIIQEENEVLSSNENTPQKTFIGTFNQREGMMEVGKELEDRCDHEDDDDDELKDFNGDFGMKKDFSEVFDKAVDGLSLCRNNDVELFKVTEEDTNQDKFSITVTSDKFKSKSNPNNSTRSDMLNLKKEESENPLKDIYQIDLEQQSNSSFPNKDFKIFEQKYYNDMSSSNDIKNTQYKSDKKNCPYNSVNKEENLLENIKESFSDHEQDEENNENNIDDDEDNLEQDENNSDYKETYTVNSSSDEEVIDQSQNEIFTEISQVRHNIQINLNQNNEEEPNFILQPFYKSSYLPKQQKDKKNWPCLVLDLDETLIHFQENQDSGQFLIRPSAKDFLIRMSRLYELGKDHLYIIN